MIWAWLRRAARELDWVVLDDPEADRLRNTKPEPRSRQTRAEFVAGIDHASITYYSSPGVSRRRRTSG